MIWDVLYAAGGVVVSTLGGGAVVLALSSWLGRVWASRILEQDRKRYEAEIEGVRAKYRHEVEEKLQMLKDRLERGQFVHRLQFETEFNIYRGLWDKLVAARNAALALRPVLDSAPADKTEDQIKRERWKAVAEAGGDFERCYASHKPFVSPEVYEAVDALGKVIFREALDYKYGDAHEQKQWWEDALKSAEAIKAHTDTICEAIRRRIGVIGVLPEEPPPREA